ncbi:RNA ligase [Anaerotardibacter muris]|uniref:RNA ligase n=1 Tax=Anaerotardibacter muris TaxID=2941505 RepID=UPI00203D6B9D|nr:RNA ligase [Anaerotardibacter muris]
MRALYLLRGAPGSGKSTWIRENGYEPLTVCPDSLRLAEAGLEFDVGGKPSISQRSDKAVWHKVGELVQARMQKGLTTILDSTMADMHDSSRFRNLAESYRYRVYVVDFTTIGMAECEKRNHKRAQYSQVPEYSIGRMYTKFKRSAVPKSIPVLTPDEAKQQIDEPTLHNVDEYVAINFIGDIHGCYTALMDLLKGIGGNSEDDFLNEDELYVFLGDYLDRGIENAQVLDYLMRISSRKNVRLLEGNHEKTLALWANSGEGRGADFEKTRNQIEGAAIEPKKVRQFIRRLGQFGYYEYREKKIFACHGGISCIPDPFGYVSAHDLINGFGVYKDIDKVEEVWEDFSRSSGIVLVHGHRANSNGSFHPYERVYCLEGGVEHGGEIRCVRFQGGEITTVEIENKVFHVDSDSSDPAQNNEDDVAHVVAALRANNCIIEKRFDEVSSFNFSDKAFLKGKWNSQTIRARGLFIDTEANKIKARSYDKFFNLEERPETSLRELSKSLRFPVDIYLKENGYLGICASDGKDGLFVASKTTPKSEHAQRFALRLESRLGGRVAEFSRYLEDNDLSAVFEVIEPQDSPHIVEYDEPRLVMLALVRNDIHFEQLPYLELRDIADRFGFESKQLLDTVKNFKEFCVWVNNLEDEDWTFRGKHIEGIVAEDSSGFMVKVKGQWYRKWKCVRGILQDIARRGRSSKSVTLGRYYKDADRIYEAALEYGGMFPTQRRGRMGLCAPPRAENVIAFRNWYEAEYLPKHP